MKRIMLLSLIVSFLVMPIVSAQGDEDTVLLARATATLHDLENLDRYAVTWEIEVREWIATFEDGVIVAGAERHLDIVYTDRYIAGEENLNFQRIATITEERLEEDSTVQYTTEIRLVDGEIYVRAQVEAGEMARGYPPEWRVWQWPEQWSALEDLLPRTYFAAIETNSLLPLFDLSAETIEALAADPNSVRLHSWPWYETQARVITITNSTDENTAPVLATHPSIDPNSPFMAAVLDHLSPELGAHDMFQLYYDSEEQDVLLGIHHGRDIESASIPFNEFEDGAPDNRTMYYSNIRRSYADFRAMDTDFVPVTAPDIP